MRKFLLTIICVMFTFVSYAKSYDELIQEAKQYESQKEWFYALGSYYNAMKISDDSDVAQQKYTELSNCIENGNPGFGEFNVFSMHDEWVNLIKNAEKYFTETFPYTLTYDTVKMDSANYEKRTANYKLAFTVDKTDFYENALEILKAGYEKTNHSDWKDLEADWFIDDYFCMQVERSAGGGSIVDSVNFYRKSIYTTKQQKINNVSEYPILQKEANSVYQKEKIALSYLSAKVSVKLSIPFMDTVEGTAISVCEIPAFAACFDTYGTLFKPGKKTCYDLKLGIYDENNNVILEGTRQTICTKNFSYQFPNVSQEKMSVLDSKKYTIKLLGIWLNYGVYDITLMTKADLENDTIRGIIKPLPDIKIAYENVEFLDKTALEEQKRLKEEKERQKEEKKRLAEEQKRLEEEKKLQSEMASWETFAGEIEKKYEEYQQQVKSIDSILEGIGEKIGVKFKKYDSSLQGCYVESVTKKTPAAKGKITSDYRLEEINDQGLWEIAEITESNEKQLRKLNELLQKAKDISKFYLYYQTEYENFENMKNEISNSFFDLPQLKNVDSFDSGTELIFYKEIKFGEYKTIKIVVP